jgi:chemotaxis protein CheZ
MTNQAANRTLNAVEGAIPLCESLHTKSAELNGEWTRFVNREMKADEFRSVSKTLHGHLEESELQLSEVKNALNEILMAQEFQDLTGQIINRVIKMVEDVESHLVNLIKVSGGTGVAGSEPEEKGKLEGPQVPNLATSETVSGQDDVDDLLSSLGF